MAARISRWLIFSVLFSLVPIFASYIGAAARQGGTLPPLNSVLENGELYLLSSSLAAVGLGEVIGGNQRWQISKIITGGFSVLNIGLSALLYAFANNNLREDAATNFANVSYFIFVFSCVVATSCVALSEVKDA